ncbi:MAG: response regulator [Nitrospirota bacterium]|nr:response regulator [Nitrospirota bacterium]
MTAQFRESTKREVRNILLTGGSSKEAAEMQDILDKSCLGRCEIVQVDDIPSAVALLETNDFRLILLALSGGIDGPGSLAKINQHAPSIPVVALSGGSDGSQWKKARKELFHGYIDSNVMSKEAVESVLMTALSIYSLRKDLKESRVRENHERRMRLLERLSGAPQPAITTHVRGIEPLKEANFEKFSELSHHYGEVLEMALAKNAPARVISDGIRTISEELGAIKAGPNDLLDIHGNALRMKSCGVSEKQADVCAEESRLMLIEAMGYLTSYYRNYSSYAVSMINSVYSSEPGTTAKPTATTAQQAR